ncbi:coenzyme Q-binding protein COQ10 homolog, mitochondrial [Gouania willdenowi]|uniref:Coenzyme Q-binding protein COQ10 homolog, mitochondrial-like n=1 Tax=Gouania willdenowi TaxID=441366 RepID=A0A8C5D4G8_GOUWI|nr:coenzyme Q-binding protein COQ10 homolog, mitochondrial-like [Gouania willdenowi]
MSHRKKLLMTLLEINEGRSASAAAGQYLRAKQRLLGSCNILSTRKSSLQLCPASPLSTPTRSFINLAASITSRRMEYAESRIVSYSPEQMYTLVASVDQYQDFVPWCKKSRVIKKRNGDVQAQLEIGFPPIVERYTSEVTVVPNHQVRALCSDGNLFSHLETIWRFTPETSGISTSCKVDLFVSFEFKSLLHSQLASLFFDEVVKQLVNAFETRAAALYRNQQEAPLRGRSA